MTDKTQCQINFLIDCWQIALERLLDVIRQHRIENIPLRSSADIFYSVCNGEFVKSVTFLGRHELVMKEQLRQIT